MVAGSRRALVITLTDGYQGSLLSGIPHNIYNEMAALAAVVSPPVTMTQFPTDNRRSIPAASCVITAQMAIRLDLAFGATAQ